MNKYQPTKEEKLLLTLVQKTPAPAKYSASNALLNIKKAYLISDVDPEMSAFRALTAEEESATAVFQSVIRRRYKNADKLNPRDHLQKNALSQFYEAASLLFIALNKEFDLNPILYQNESKTPPVLEIKYNARKIDPNKLYFIPNYPLEFSIQKKGGEFYDFSGELQKIADSKSVKNITKRLRERANTRNLILYASPKGLPSVSNLEKFLKSQRAFVNRNVILYLLIDPYKKHQSFVQQSLYSFLKMIGKLQDDINFL